MAHTPRQLLAKYSLRAHFLGLLLVVSLSGAGLNRLLLTMGWEDLVARTGASFCAAYGLFFFFARLWLHVLSSDSRLLHDAAEREEEPAIAPSPKPKETAGWADWITWLVPVDGEGAIVLFALAGGLVRGLKRGPSEGWASVLFRRSIIPFLILLAINLVAVQAAHVRCPGNDRLSTMVRACNQNPAAISR